MRGLRSLPGMETAAFNAALVDVRNEIYTPGWLQEIIGAVDLDPCSPPHRPLKIAREHYVLSEGKDGLALPWMERTYVNPPYQGRGVQKAWVKRCWEATTGECESETVIGLVQSAPGSGYWNRYVWPHAAVGFFRRRIAFELPTGGTEGTGQFDSALLVWGAMPDGLMERSAEKVRWVQEVKIRRIRRRQKVAAVTTESQLSLVG